ncbi:uncharacterized protein LOC135371363 isoform X2 [Ornithodoros turicata]|uniref:uncharacterized protein LOC135371363 isoform X2 n=1 Tax=Ornithodoros turicata TaxID=34597 RepID=UPI00313874C4
MTTVGIHKSALELHKLLERAVLTSYYDKFIEIGGDNVQQLRDSSGHDFQELINMVDMARKPPHVKRFKKALAEWKPDTVAATSTPADEAEGELHKLLRGADLLSYHDKFMEIGGDNVQELFDSTAEDFQEVIDLVDMATKPFHVKRLKKALGQWTGQSVAVASSAADESEGEVHELLRRADLLSYHDKFIELGKDNVQQLCDSTDEEFQTLTEHVGMARKPLHVKRLKNALKQWSGHAAVMTSIPSNESEREVHELLQRADLLAYYDKFIEKGVDNVQQLFDSTEEEFQEFMDLVGMAGFPFHVMRFQNELEQSTGHPVAMTSVPATKPRLSEIHHLLEPAGLLFYCEKFEEIGMDNVQQLRDLTDEEFHEVINRVDMVRKPFHVKKLKKVLEEWTGPAGISRFVSKDMASTSEFDLNMERSPQWEDVRKEMHEAIVAKDEARVLKCLDAAPDLKLWLDPVKEKGKKEKEKSARYKAVEEKAFRIHGLLVSRECGLKDDEESSCYEGLTRLEKAEIRRQRYYTTECEGNYIDYLKSKSLSVTRCGDFGVRLEKMFKRLSNDEVNRIILKVAARAPHLEIRFDYNSGNVQGITGSCNRGDIGLTYYEEQRVFIGGRAEEAVVWGTLMHELCHMALFLVYRNDGKPYYSDDTERKQQYKNILNNIKPRQKELNILIQQALKDRNGEEELIVRIPHVLVQYGCDEGHRILEREVPELLNFFKDRVIPDMREYIKSGIPSADAEKIREGNATLQRSLNIGKLNVKFEKPLKNSVWNKGPLHLLTGPEVRLLEIMVHNAVKSSGQPYLFFEASQKEWKDVLTTYKCAFVLVTIHPNTEFGMDLKFLSEVSSVTEAKVIFLVEDRDNDDLLKQVQEDTFFAAGLVVHNILEASLEHVANSCKAEVFKNSRVELQGEYVSGFPEAMNINTFLRFVDTSVFLKLCESLYIDVGPPLHELEEGVKNCYVERLFTRVVKIDLKKCRMDDENEAFALLGCPDDCAAKLVPQGYEAKHQDNLESFEKFVVLQEPRDYEALLKNDNYQGKVVHLLRISESGEGLMWIKSNDRLSHLPMMGSHYYTTETLLKVPEKVVLVTGAPGMGKTVLASRLCTQLKSQDKKRWVLYVDLPQRMASVKTASPSLKYLADLCQVRKGGLEFVLFEESLNNGSPFEVVVTLDGFDEVNEECRNCVLNLIRFLANKKVYKVYLLTRTVFKPHVQDTLHSVSYDLVPFSDENQNEFLTRYRGQIETPATRNDAFAQKFQQVYATLKEKNKTILETPLLLRMMAEMESGEITKSGDYSSLLEIADISAGGSIYTVHIYKMFVEYKHLVHRKEKVKEDIALSAVRGDNDATKSPFYANHGLLAMKCIFPQDALKTLLSEEELVQLDPGGSFIKRVADNYLKEGFVNGINDGGTPEFVHKTFAEFFAAHYLLEKAKIREKPSFRNKVLESYGKKDYEGVMLLFDGLASESYRLHSAVMNNDVSYFRQHVIQREDMLKVDELKRTPLHVAALHANKTALKRLPMDDELIMDDLFKMSPFEYVELFSPWDAELMRHLWEGHLRERSLMTYLPNANIWKNYFRTADLKKYLRTETSPVRERLNVLCDRCSEEAVRRSTQNLRRCETFEQKRHFLERAIFTAVIHDLRGVLDVYLSYVSPRESTGNLNGDTMDQLESRKNRSSRCSAESSVIGNLDSFTDSSGRTVPFYAESEVVFNMLLPYCDMGILDYDGNTLLHISAEEGNLETTQFYLAHISVNNRNRRFETPLHLSRDAEIVKLLLPSSVNVLDYEQHAPMDICAKRDDLEAMKLLLLRTGTYDTHHMRLNTTLHVASKSHSLKAVTFLLPHTSAHLLNCEGETCLDVATPSLKYRFRSDFNVVGCLIPHSLVNSPETFGSSPLYVWAKCGGRKVMQTLWPYLRHSDPRHAQRISRSSVYVSANGDFQKEIWCLKLLFLHLDVIAGDLYSRKLLHNIAKDKLREIKEVNYINYVKFLLPHLNLSEQDYVERGVENEDIVTLYRRWSDMNNTDHQHIDDVDTEMVDNDGNMKLLIEAEEGNVEAVKIHLSPSSVCFTDEKENTALHLSARKGHPNVVKLLIPFYTSVDVINVDRKTPMHVCASNGHLAVVKLLLLRSSMSSRDNVGMTPLHWACYSGAVDVVNFLLPHSFPNMCDTWGFTCCAFSAIKEKMNVVRCLIPHSLMNCPHCIGDSQERFFPKRYMREELVTLLPYSCDYDAASLLTILPLSSRRGYTRMRTTPCLKLMVLHSDVRAVDKCLREALNTIREFYEESNPILCSRETEMSLLLNYISLLLPHANVSPKEDEGKKLLQGAL